MSKTISKKSISFLVISIFLIQILFMNIKIVSGYQTQDDLGIIISAELNSNTPEIKGSSLMTTGTHAFYETPELDLVTSEHDITSIDVSKVQIPSYTTTGTEAFEIIDPTFNTNETQFLNESINEYTCDGGLDTIISLNIDYESNDNDIIEIFNEDFTGDQWALYDMNSSTIQYSLSLNKDSLVSIGQPTTNFGTLPYLEVSEYVGSVQSYIGTAIPYLYESKYANSLLHLYVYVICAPYYGYIDAYTTSNFNEYTITWINKPSASTFVGSTYISSTGWKTISLSSISNYYCLLTDEYHSANDIYSRETGLPPYITHYLNKFYQNTGSGYFYMQTATNGEMVNAKSPVYDDTTYITAGDHIVLDCQTISSEQLKLKLWNDGSVVKEYQVFAYGNTDYTRHLVNITVDEYTEFDQMSINGKFDNTEYFKCWDISVEEHVGKHFFSKCYIDDFTYNVLGQNYTQDFELILDQTSSDSTSSEGNYVFYFDSSMFSDRDENDDVIIHSQTLTFNLTMNIERDVNITVNASYSSNSWVIPSVVGLKINGEEVSDESTNSGYCALADFPENLVITSTSQCYFRLDITSLFSFTFDLDVISKTYLRKSFKLVSNHDINLTSISFPETLWIKKIYLNNIDYDDDNPLTLNPKVEMATNSIFKLEVITYGEVYIPLNQEVEGGYHIIYSEDFATTTSEMTHSYFFNEYDYDYSIEGELYMRNEYPSQTYEENWSDWNLDYNSTYTTSSFSNGNISSTLNNISSMNAPCSDDFTVINGTLSQNGSLDEIDGSYMIFNSTEAGHYPATYSFTDDLEGSQPDDWDIYENGGDVRVINELDGHKNILRLSDESATEYVHAYNDFNQNQENGSIDFWIRADDATKNNGVYLRQSTTLGVYFVMYQDAFKYRIGGTYYTIVSANDDQWYHVRIDFECGNGGYQGLSADTFYVYIDGVKYGAYGFYASLTEADNFRFVSNSAESSYTYYTDAIGYSWDDNYTLGNNWYWQNYEGAYTFEDDKTQDDPNGWTVDETGGTVNVVGFDDYHKKNVQLYDSSGASSVSMNIDFDSAKTLGTYEFYFRTTDNTKLFYMQLMESTTTRVNIYVQSGYLKYNDAGTPTDICTIDNDQWYHLRVDFNCSNDKTDIYVDGTLEIDDGNFLSGATNLDQLRMLTQSTSSGFSCYFDAIGFDWLDNYTIGDNLNLNYYPSFNATTTFQLNTEPFQSSFNITSISLNYSMKTNISQEINISIYDFINMNYVLINSSSEFNDFYHLSYDMNITTQVNGSYYIIVKFEGLNETEDFLLFLEELHVQITYVSNIENNAIISKQLNFDFFSDFNDAKYGDYQKVFNINVSLSYRFTLNDSDLGYQAYLNDTQLNCNGSWNILQKDFEFNKDLEVISLVFNIMNGLLEINSMDYLIEFKCINLNGQYQIYQYFKFSPDFTLTSNDITKEEIFLNFTYNFTPTSLTDLIYNNTITNNILSYRINIQGESGWIYQDLGFNITSSESEGVNLTSILHEYDQTSFQDIFIEFYISGHGSSLVVDDFNISTLMNKIQLTGTPRTDVNSVEFQEPMIANRSYTYWYFENSFTLNDASLTDVETSETITSFTINGSKYFFQESLYGNDLILGLMDYNPHWDVSYEVLINNGTYTRMKIEYSADFTINNVSIVLDLKNDGILNDNWTLGTQDSYTFKLIIPEISFSSMTQTMYIEGFSTIPYASMSSYESDQNWNQIMVNSQINFAGYLTYPKYTQVFLLTKETDWTAYSVYYGSSIYSAETMNPTLIKVSGEGFDPDVSDSYLYFKTSPFKSVDFNFDGTMITITINCSINVENAYFLYPFDPSGVHNLAVDSSNNSVLIQGLTDMGDFEGYLYFACEKIYSGITQIKISVNFATPLEMLVQSVIVFVIAGIAIIGYYYIKRNEEKVEKLSKKIGTKLRAKLSRKKESEGLKEISISIKDDKLYLEDKR